MQLSPLSVRLIKFSDPWSHILWDQASMLGSTLSRESIGCLLPLSLPALTLFLSKMNESFKNVEEAVLMLAGKYKPGYWLNRAEDMTN